jgi:hypothetical protein
LDELVEWRRSVEGAALDRSLDVAPGNVEPSTARAQSIAADLVCEWETSLRLKLFALERHDHLPDFVKTRVNQDIPLSHHRLWPYWRSSHDGAYAAPDRPLPEHSFTSTTTARKLKGYRHASGR